MVSLKRDEGPEVVIPATPPEKLAQMRNHASRRK